MANPYQSPPPSNEPSWLARLLLRPFGKWDILWGIVAALVLIFFSRFVHDFVLTDGDLLRNPHLYTITLWINGITLLTLLPLGFFMKNRAGYWLGLLTVPVAWVVFLLIVTRQ